MSKKRLIKHSLEVLEGRIAPAAVTGPLLPSGNDKYVQAAFNGPVPVEQGQVLNTTGDANSGTYFLYMEKGNALAFFTDFNNNGEIDFNELTGLSLGDGARVIIFSDVHGDIVTNLQETRAVIPGPNGGSVLTKLTLTDSDNNAANDNPLFPGDGRVLLNNTIEKIELRSLRTTDLPDQNGDGIIDDKDIALRKAPSTYSIFGNIYAGRGFGADDGGLIIDTTGESNFGFTTIPTIGSIKTGTAASGEFFSFGVSRADNVSGTLTTFVPAANQPGADINGVRAADPSMRFNLNTLHAGDGGNGARGGNVSNVIITADDSGGYEVIAGNGGNGINGGNGGSILNFSDLGSQTGKVVIRSGDGGMGTSGVGGNGGNFSFETFNVRGNVSLQLGNGGDGFTRGGDGASLLKGDFSQPNFSAFTPANATGAYHEFALDGLYAANIGTHGAVDFDKDGYGDFVYVTRDTSQLVVMFGDGNGGFRTRLRADGVLEPDRVYLSGIRNPEALTIADLNGDGILDIATASTDEGSHAGVAVFLGKFEHEGSGTLTGSEDLNHNGVNDFLGFRDVRFSALPELYTYGRGGTTIRGFWPGPQQITSIVAGDFDGNGQAELAVVVTYYDLASQDNGSGVITGLSRPSQVLMFLKGDVEKDNLTGEMKMTGQFYADFGTKGTETTGGTPAPQTPFFIVATNTDAESEKSVPRVIIEASALSSTSTHDVVFVGVTDKKEVFTVEYSPTQTDIGAAPTQLGSFKLGKVDTDRQLAEAGNAHRDEADVTLLDFTVFDYGADGTPDGTADIAVISKTPELFLVGVKGDGNGGGTQTSGNGVDNSGNYFGDKGFKVANQLLNIKSVDVDGDGYQDDLALNYLNGQPQGPLIGLYEYQEGILDPDPSHTATRDTQKTGAIFKLEFDPEPLDFVAYGGPSVFAVYFPHSDDLTLPGFGYTDSVGISGFTFTKMSVIANTRLAVSVGSYQLTENGLDITAGDGGNSQIGNGGKGGSLGGGSVVQETQRTVLDANGNVVTITVKDLIGSFNLVASGDVKLEAGNGGDGFAKGGDGGDVTGVVVRQRANDRTAVTTSVVSGSGGRGVSANGGNGGDLFGNSLDGWEVRMVTGDGGSGAIGGHGGDVRGNGTIVYDSQSAVLNILTGDGGNGARKGGAGGTISNLSPIVSRTLLDRGTAFDLGSVIYTTGHGGDAVSGPGGSGGSILNSSPQLNAIIDDEVSLFAGNGGNGTVGGNGGSITKFITKLDTSSKNPAIFNALAGHGGIGSAGSGGTGGSITNVTVPSRGLDSFNRVMAGNGGSSAAGKGGNGGNINDVATGSVEGAVAVVAGAGGHGLTAGGRGGSVLKIDLDLGGSSVVAKGLVIAGAGGDATAFIPNANDGAKNQAENAFGGTIGRGGEGGSIIGLTQIGSDSAHADLIAGNGGSTLNYGTLFDKKSYVGNGGSVKNVTMKGNIGNILADKAETEDVDENVPITSYNSIIKGETIARYVETKLRYSTGILSDADGNVGIIVGAAGNIKATIQDPVNAPGQYTAFRDPRGRNGSLIDVHVNNLMSAVAGSVDRIAAIQVVKGLYAFGDISSDKGSFIEPGIDEETLPDPVTGDLHKGYGTVGANSRDFLQKDLNTKTTAGEPALDGALIDGAVVTKVLLDGRGKPTFQDGVYIVL